MRGKLGYLSARQEALAQNIANVDTPGYKAMDVAEPDFKRMLGSSGGGKLKMSATSPAHLGQGSGGLSSAFKMEKRKKTDELNPNDNNVVTEEEMAKIGQNQMEYQKVLNMYGKTVAMFKTAIGNPGGGG